MKIINLVASCLFLLGLAIGLTVQSETLDCHHFTACSVSQVNENGVTGTQVDYDYQGCMGSGGLAGAHA